MDARLQKLITEVDGLINCLQEVEKRVAPAIEKVAENHRRGAVNLVHYAELRQHDVRAIQGGLASIGATRLSTAEPAVLARLHAARNVLSAYNDEPLRYAGADVREAFVTADDILEDHALNLLGDSSEETHSRIMVTLPTEAGDDLDLVRGFVDAGMELARINCAHDGAEVWKRMIDNVRTAARESGREIRIAMDLAGPKVRTGQIEPGPEVGRARVTREDTGAVITPSKIWLTPDDLAEADTPPVPAGLPGRPTLPLRVKREWLKTLEVGSDITFRDNRNAKRTFTVTRFEGQGVLAEGNRNAYVSNATLLETDRARSRVSGVPPTEQRLRLHIGDTLILTDDQTPAVVAPGVTPRISCTLPEAVAAIEVGQKVLFDDGSIAARAVDKQVTEQGHHEVHLTVTYAGPEGTKLAAYKGINLPDTVLPLPSLTEEDLAAFRFVAEHGDIANISFIRDPDDVGFVLDTLEQIAQESADPERVRRLGIVLKIETIPAFENLCGVLLAGMRHPNLGIMIARGDLAVELGFERMAEVPRLIAQMAEAAHVPVIMATQVLESMAKSGLPTRAEITDAAYALRSEAVMLNKGPHITDAIRILHTLSTRLGRSQRKNRQMLRQIGSWMPENE